MLYRSQGHNPSPPHEPQSRPPTATARLLRSSSPLKFFASPIPIKLEEDRRKSQKEWTATYLADLRSNKPLRPKGSRPLINRNDSSTPISELEPSLRPFSALDFARPSILMPRTTPDPTMILDRCTSAMSDRRVMSALSHEEDSNHMRKDSGSGQPSASLSPRDLTSSQLSMKPPVTPSNTCYIERGQRRMEKQEARMLREALDEIDQRDEARLHAAAQHEASDIIWKHQNLGAQYRLRGLPFETQLDDRQNDRERSTSFNHTSAAIPKDGHSSSSRSASSEPMPSTNAKSESDSCRDFSAWPEAAKGFRNEKIETASQGGHEFRDSPQKMVHVNLDFQIPRIKSSSRRRVSGPKSGKSSGGLFSNPEDKIYEEPEAAQVQGQQSYHGDIPAPLKLRTRNSIARLQSGSHGFFRSKIAPKMDDRKTFKTEIHRNLPSQSRNPAYTENKFYSDLLITKDNTVNKSLGGKVAANNGIEIRGEDIRAATSMRMKDRSPKLPSPTVVSDKPGRPIVSFDRNWKPHDLTLEQAQSVPRGGPPAPSILLSEPQLPESTASAPIVPTIKEPSLPSVKTGTPPIPSINVATVPSLSISACPSDPEAEAAIPSISVSGPSESSQPTQSGRRSCPPSPFRRPLPHHSSTAPVATSTLHWSPSASNRPTAQCAACALPIAGRIVSAASQRFHPDCFTCFHCGELLECVAFYPEPTTNRENRLERIQLRASATDALDAIDGHTAVDDGDSALRFYCHLDFHELFSPRCRSCRTPIEGEVVLACGGEWHKGHFFCAQCGDPFDENTPFVEKDGYAWCVGCHAGRFNGKCKGCRNVILEHGVQALGGEWHERCFCCLECGGGFQDGRFFTRGDCEKPVCVGCEERRLKA